jgi:hypothetical protein
VSSVSQAIVLAEDARQAQFARRYLLKIGYSKHAIRIASLPGGRGCGEQWVREHYAKEVKAYRARSTRARTALLVAIDADTDSTENRSRQLDNALRASGLDQRTAGEAISHFIPKRNIETWVLCLCGETVDEETDYSRRDVEQLIGPSAITFFGWTRENTTLPPHCVLSLSAAIPEAKRLE